MVWECFSLKFGGVALVLCVSGLACFLRCRGVRSRGVGGCDGPDTGLGCLVSLPLFLGEDFVVFLSEAGGVACVLSNGLEGL